MCACVLKGQRAFEFSGFDYRSVGHYAYVSAHTLFRDGVHRSEWCLQAHGLSLPSLPKGCCCLFELTLRVQTAMHVYVFVMHVLCIDVSGNSMAKMHKQLNQCHCLLTKLYLLVQGNTDS